MVIQSYVNVYQRVATVAIGKFFIASVRINCRFLQQFQVFIPAEWLDRCLPSGIIKHSVLENRPFYSEFPIRNGDFP